MIDIDELYKRARGRVYDTDKTLSFHNDCEEAFEFKDMPPDVKSRIHYLAYEQGHAAGYSDMVTQYFDLVELAKLCFKNK